MNKPKFKLFQRVKVIQFVEPIMLGAKGIVVSCHDFSDDMNRTDYNYKVIFKDKEYDYSVERLCGEHQLKDALD